MNAAGPTGATVFFPCGAYLVSAPLKWDKTNAVTPQFAPSLVGAPGYGGPTADVSATVAPVSLVASPTFPIGEFMIDYIGPTMAASLPQLCLTSFVIQGLVLECAQRAAGLRLVQEEFFIGRGITINRAAAPAPANNTGSPKAAFNLVIPTASFGGSYNNRLERCAAILAAQDSYYCSEGFTSSVLLDHCVSLQPGRYGFNCGPATILRGCDSETAGTAEYYVIGTIMDHCTIDVFAGSGNAIRINSDNQPWPANPNLATQFIGCAFVGTNTAALTEANGAMVYVTWESAHITFVGCAFEAGTGTTDWVYVDSRNGAACQCDFVGCQFGLYGGAPLTAKYNLNGAPASILRFKDTRGFNPAGPLAAPAVPATTVALANPFPYDCTVFVAGGTVTVIAVGGTATGLTSGSIRVPAGQTITLTYTVAPTWTWFGD